MMVMPAIEKFKGSALRIMLALRPSTDNIERHEKLFQILMP